MLFIDNATVERLLPMDECIDAQDYAFRGLPTGESVHRPRIDLYMPAERPDGYYRWGTMEGASDALGVFAIRMKSDILYCRATSTATGRRRSTAWSRARTAG